MGARSIQPLVAGNSHGSGLYDKTAECISYFQNGCGNSPKDIEPLEFENEYGFPPERSLTRVERQIGEENPDELSTFGSMVRKP